MVKFVEEIIQARRKQKMSESLNNNNKVPKDVVDVLLNDGSHEITDDLIAENVIDMMIPGQDSVPILMTLAIKYLSDCPAALQQLRVRQSHSIVTFYYVDELSDPFLEYTRLGEDLNFQSCTNVFIIKVSPFNT